MELGCVHLAFDCEAGPSPLLNQSCHSDQRAPFPANINTISIGWNYEDYFQIKLDSR